MAEALKGKKAREPGRSEGKGGELACGYQEAGRNSNRSGFECRNSGDPSAERKCTSCDTTERIF